MTADRQRLEQERDQALRDLLDLDRQVAAGELPPAVADRLRLGYESMAASAIALLNRAEGHPPRPAPAAPSDQEPDAVVGPEAAADVPLETTDDTRAARTGRAARARAALYGLALVAAVFAAAVLLPDSLGDRVAGGAVSGNEVFGTGSPQEAPDTPRDLSTVTNAEMEQVIEQNPDVVDMRLALAHRYLDGGDYLAAARHYLVALRQEPRDVEALSHYGWLLLQLDDPQQAADYVDRALAQDPQQAEALWFKANIALYGLSDPATATTVLQQMQGLELPADVRAQVYQLLQQTRAGAGGG